MNYWLFKTEPDCYAWDNLVRDKRTAWDGVTNALALKHLRAVQKGDLALIYHTGDERSVIGIAEITKAAYPDPNEDNEKIVVVDVKVQRKLKTPVSLAEIKADRKFAGWDLLRNGRLGVVPVPQPMWDHLLKLSEAKRVAI